MVGACGHAHAEHRGGEYEVHGEERRAAGERGLGGRVASGAVRVRVGSHVQVLEQALLLRVRVRDRVRVRVRVRLA